MKVTPQIEPSPELLTTEEVILPLATGSQAATTVSPGKRANSLPQVTGIAVSLK